jgi:hypothetical protein
MDPVHCIASYANVQLSISRAEPTLAFVQVAMRLVREAVRDFPDGIALLIVINAVAPPPSDAARDYIKNGLNHSGPALRGVARVIEGQGFASAAKRSAMSLLDLLMRPPYPTKIFGDVSEASVWVVQTLSRGPRIRFNPTDLVNAVQEMRSAHDSRMPALASVP